MDRKLADSPDEITEVLIGHRVFGLPIDYNPGDNSIVRTQARTLRDRLERYFRGEGAHEPVVLENPARLRSRFFVSANGLSNLNQQLSPDR